MMMKMMAARHHGGCARGSGPFRCGGGPMMMAASATSNDRIYEDKSNREYHVSIDIPGVKLNNMTLTVEDNGQVLQLTATRSGTNGRVERRFALGSDVDT